MREKIVYIADDDTEFDTKEECLQHEEKQRTIDFLWENVFCYTTDEKPLNFDGQDLEEQLMRFENAFSFATVIEICEEVPQEVSDFLSLYFGFEEFENELRLPGKYVYSYEDLKWLPQ